MITLNGSKHITKRILTYLIRISTQNVGFLLCMLTTWVCFPASKIIRGRPKGSSKFDWLKKIPSSFKECWNPCFICRELQRAVTELEKAEPLWKNTPMASRNQVLLKKYRKRIFVCENSSLLPQCLSMLFSSGFSISKDNESVQNVLYLIHLSTKPAWYFTTQLFNSCWEFWPQTLRKKLIGQGSKVGGHLNYPYQTKSSR